MLLVALLLAASWVLRRTRYGLHVYAVGGDARSIRLPAVRAQCVVFATFVLSGLLAATAGIFLSARLGAGLPNSGVGLELESIAVAVLGVLRDRHRIRLFPARRSSPCLTCPLDGPLSVPAAG